MQFAGQSTIGRSIASGDAALQLYTAAQRCPLFAMFRRGPRCRLILFPILCLWIGASSIRAKEYDLCIYGATSGGVVAALQADRMGKLVVLLEPFEHVGGMTASGLSALDVGNLATIGGITREYFAKLAARYGKELKFENFFAHTGGDFVIEPSGAEKLFLEYIADSDIDLHYDKKIISAQKEGTQIRSITMLDGSTYKAKVFIDATYEGDLMARADVSYTMTREANSKYGETGNGFSLKKYVPSLYWGVPGENETADPIEKGSGTVTFLSLLT